MTTDPQHNIRLWMQQQLIQRGRGAKGQLAQRLGVRNDAITRMMNTDPEKEMREISVHELAAMQRFFGSTPPDIELPTRMVPIMGLAGAGPDSSVLYAESDGQFGDIQAPEDEETVAALEVRGDSMYGVAQDGWIIFYEDPMPWHESMAGQLCVCFMADGRVLVKIPYPSKNPGFFNLESSSAPSMHDVVVERFAPVTDIKTRRAAQRYLRRYPDRAVPELKIGRSY